MSSPKDTYDANDDIALSPSFFIHFPSPSLFHTLALSSFLYRVAIFFLSTLSVGRSGEGAGPVGHHDV